jgi:hypothetical protein
MDAQDIKDEIERQITKMDSIDYAVRTENIIRRQDEKERKERKEREDLEAEKKKKKK